MGAIILILIGVAVVVAIGMSFFVRRHGEPRSGAGPAPDWVRTDEVFRDPGTERMMRVWVDRSGERHYVPDAG